MSTCRIVRITVSLRHARDSIRRKASYRDSTRLQTIRSLPIPPPAAQSGGLDMCIRQRHTLFIWSFSKEPGVLGLLLLLHLVGLALGLGALVCQLVLLERHKCAGDPAARMVSVEMGRALLVCEIVKVVLLD